MIPDYFREFDRVAQESFEFLVSEKGCSEPTVEYWRDYYLAYETPTNIKISVGTERGMAKVGWLGVFINIAYLEKGHVLFFLDSVLEELGIPVNAKQQSWPDNIKEYAAVVASHFDAIVDYIRARGAEKATQDPGSESQGSGLVLRGADGSTTKMMYTGAGVHFWGSQFLPIGRQGFWRIVDKGYSPTYAACRCPSCGYVGNVGQKGAGTFVILRCIKFILLLIVLISVVGCVVVDAWRQSDLMVPVTAGAFFAWILSRLVDAKLPQRLVAWCPECGCESKEFSMEGPPPTINDRVNPLRFG